MSCGGNYQIGFTDQTPHTIVGAKPDEHEHVINRRVIHVIGASYRASHFSGTFELERQSGNPFIPSRKGVRVKVICHWFCCRPESMWPKLLIENSDYEIEEGYTGKVARNIGL